MKVAVKNIRRLRNKTIEILKKWSEVSSFMEVLKDYCIKV